MANSSFSNYMSQWKEPSIKVNQPQTTTPSPTPNMEPQSKFDAVTKAAQEKQARVANSTLGTGMYGTPEQQRVVATAYEQGNNIPDRQMLDDARQMNIIDFANTYGEAAARDRHLFGSAVMDYQQDKDNRRTWGQRAVDAPFGALAVGANLIGNPLGLAAKAVPVVGDQLGVGIDRGTEAVSNYLRSWQTQDMQDIRAQHELEGSLNSVDADTRLKERLAAIDENAPGARGEINKAKAQRVGEGFVDSVKNFGDSPEMIFEALPEMAGYAIPTAWGTRIAAGAKALKHAKTITGSTEAAKAALATKTGRAIIGKEAVRMMPYSIGIGEAAGASQQATLTVDSMSHDKLMENENYAKLIAEGKSEKEARESIAAWAGLMAGATSLPITVLLGKLGSLEKGMVVGATRGNVGTSAKRALTDVAREGVEETSQGTVGEAASNFAINALGTETALIEGLGEAAGQSLVMGLAGTAQMKAPSATLGTTGELARAGGRKIMTAAEESSRRREEELANEAGIGQEAQRVAQQAAAAEAVTIQQAAQLTAPETIEATPGQAPELSETSTTEAPVVDPRTEIATQVRDSIFYPDDEAQDYLQMWRSAGNAELANQVEQEIAQQGGLTRSTIINQLGSGITSENPAEAAQMSVEVIAQRDAMARLSSPDMVKQIGELNEDDAIRQSFDNLQEQVATLNANPVIETAVNKIKSLNENDLNTIFGKALLKSDQVDAKQRSSIARALDTIARYKSDMITEEQLTNVETALSQKYKFGDTPTSDIKVAMATIKSLKANIKALESKIASETAYQNTRGQAGKSAEQVQSDIRGRNSYDADGSTADTGYEKKTLPQHREEIGELIATGQLTDAKSSIEALLGFGRSMSEKVAALNESYEGATAENPRGPKVGYKAFNGLKEFAAKEKNWLNVHMGNSASRNFANMVYEDANMVAATANEMLVKFKEAGGQIEDAGVSVTRLNENIVLDGSRLSEPVTPAMISDLLAAEAELNAYRQQEPERRIRKDAVAYSETMTGNKPAAIKKKENKATSQKKEAKPKTSEEPTSYVVPDPVQKVINKVQKRLKGKKTQVVVKSLEKSLASHNKKNSIISLDLEAIAKDYAGGLTYLTGHGTNKSAAASKQKAEVFKNIDLQAFQDYLSSNGLETYVEFIIEHELEHARQNARGELANYGDLMSPTAIKLEREANEAAFKAIGFVPESVPVESQIEENETTESGSLKEALPNLLTIGEENHFTSSFERSEENSEFLDQEKPHIYVLENNQTVNKKQAGLIGKFRNYWFGADGNAGLVGGLNQQLKTKLNQKNRKDERGYDISAKKLIEAGDKDIAAEVQFLAMNLVEKVDDDTYVYSPKVMEAAGMAVLEWLTGASTQNNRRASEDQIMKTFGIQKREDITDDHRNATASGESMQRSMDIISDKMIRILGVKANDDVTTTYTQGIAKSLAGNILQKMNNDGWITREEFDVSVKGSTRKFRRIDVTPKGGEIASELRVNPTIFTDTFTDGRDKPIYIGEPGPDLQRFKIRQRQNINSQIENNALAQSQESPNRVNTGFFGFVTDTVGRAQFEKLLGVNEDFTQRNYTDATATDSRNKVITNALDTMEALVEEVKNWAEVNNITDPNEAEMYFSWAFSSVGRMQQQGSVTPQSNKVMRELLAATRSVLDPSNQTHENALMLAVAQSVGMKVEKLYPEQIFQNLTKMMNENPGLKEAVALIRQQENGETVADGAINDALVLAQENGLDSSMKAMHAIYVYASFQNAKEKGDAEFVTYIAFESDGKTDGPANAIVNMGSGRPKDTDVELMAISGLFFGSEEVINLNRYISGDILEGGMKPHTDDMYNKTQKRFQENLIARLQVMKPAQRERAVTVMRLVNSFSELFEFQEKGDDFDVIDNGKPIEDDGDIVKVARDFVKNPLTIFLYGSSQQGISGNLADEVLSGLFKKLSELVADGYTSENGVSGLEHPFFKDRPELVADVLKVMFNNEKWAMEKFFKDPQGGVLNPPKNEVSKNAKRVSEYEKGLGWIKTHLRNAMDSTITGTLLDAVDQTTGGLRKNMQIIQAATQIQGAVFQAKFEELITQRKKEKIESGELKSDHQLSVNDYRWAFAEANEFAPIYDSQNQTFDLSSVEKSETSETVSRSFDNKYNAGASVVRPEEVGVKSSAFFVIGTGDGKMIAKIYGEPGPDMKQTLQVFDGIEMNLTNTQEIAEHINKKVTEGWFEDGIPTMVEKVFSQFLTEDMPNSMELNEEIQSIFDNLQKNTFIQVHDMEHLHVMIREMSDENLARKRSMKRMQVSNDHMAGLMAAYVHKGEVVEGMVDYDHKAVAELWGKLYDEELQKIQDSRKKDADPEQTSIVQNMYKGLIDEVVKSSNPVARDVHKISGRELLNNLEIAGGMSGAQNKIFLAQMAEDIRLDEITVYMGTTTNRGKNSANLTALKRDLYGDTLSGDTIEAGEYFGKSKIMFIANMAPETILHELMHAQTKSKFDRYYSNPKSLKDYEQAAVKRLENLMDRFKGLNFDGREDSEARAAVTLQKILSNDKMSEADKMGEFSSWMLTNQKLIGLGKKVKTASMLYKIGREALKMLQKLLGIKSRPGTNMFENVRFNTEILAREEQDTLDVMDLAADTDAVLKQEYGPNALLDRSEAKYRNQLKMVLESRTKNPRLNENQQNVEAEYLRKKYEDLAKISAESINMAGWNLDQREANLYQAIHAAMYAAAGLEPVGMRKLQKVMSKAIQAVEGTGDKRLNFLLRDGLQAGNGTDKVATFIALSQTSKDFRTFLNNLPSDKILDKPAKGKESYLDQWFDAMTDAGINLLTHASLKGEKKTSHVAMLDGIAGTLATLDNDKRAVAEVITSKYITKGNEVGSNLLNNAGKRLGEAARSARENTNNKYLRSATMAADFVSIMISKDEATRAANAMDDIVNKFKGSYEMTALYNDFRGDSKDKWPITQLLNRAKFAVDAVRQNFRENVPEILDSKFKTVVTKEEWSRATTGIMKTDLLSMGTKEALTILENPDSVGSRITAMEDLAKSLGAKPKHISQAKDLAKLMMTGKAQSNNQHTNAYAIIREAGEKTGKKKVDEKLVNSIDRLATLYAYEMAPADVKASMKDMIKRDKEAMDALVSYQQTTRRQELEKLEKSPLAAKMRINGWKGHVVQATQQGHTIVIDKASNHQKRIMTGYQKVGVYRGSKYDNRGHKLYYYASTVGGQAAFRQSIAQTVHETFNGVDVRTGISSDRPHGGAIMGRKARNIHSRMTIVHGVEQKEALLPRYNENGEIIGYERMLDPDQLNVLNVDDHMGRSLGAWAGRVLEEKISQDINRELVKVSKAQYDKDVQAGKGDWYRNVASKDHPDPIIRDAWNVLGFDIKDEAAKVFGEENFFPVRKDSEELVLGFRQASVRDLWTDKSRFNDEMRKGVRDSLTLFGGRNTYKILVNAESAIQEAVSWAKANILIRSGVVMVGNEISNYLHMATYGMTPLQILKSKRAKYLEISQYVANEEKRVELEVELGASLTKPARKKRIEAELNMLEEVNNKMTIKPLIDAGEFNTIAEGLTEADLALRNGKFFDWVETQADKMPTWARDAARYGMIAKDTALFKGLNRAVQYGDFTAKAALYDHMTKNQNMDGKEAIRVLSEEFVNYNKLGGRGREYLEAMGLMWFYNYKLRISKILFNGIRERPAGTLLVSGGLGPLLDADTVFTGSIFGKAAAGTVGGSLGWEMGIDSLTLNPWLNAGEAVGG